MSNDLNFERHPDKVTAHINVWLILTVIVGTVGLGIGSFLSRRYWIDQNASGLRNRAEKLYAENDRSAAVTAMGRYLKLRPKDEEASLMLADWIQEGDQSVQSMMRLHRILGDFLADHPERNDLRKRFVRLSAAMERHDEVIEQHLSHLKNEIPDDAKLLDLAVASYIATRKPDQAADLYLDAIKRNAQATANYMGLVRLIESQSTPLKDLSVVANAFGIDLGESPDSDAPPLESPDDPGDASTLDDDAPAAAQPKGRRPDTETVVEAILAAMLATGRPEIDARVALANYRLTHGHEEEAERLANEALASEPDHVGANLVAIETAMRRRQKSLADQDREGADTAKDLARDHAKRLVERENPDWWALVFLGRLQAEEGQIELAHQTLRRAVDEVDRALKSQADSVADPGEAVNMRFQAIWALAELLLSTEMQDDPNRSEQARAELAELTEKLRTTSIRGEFVELLEARRLVVDRQWASAVGKLQGIREKLKDQRAAQRLVDEALVECFDFLQNPEAKRKALDLALSADPDWYAGWASLGSTLMQLGLEQRAADAFERSSRGGRVPVEALRLAMAEQTRLPPAKRNWEAIEKFLQSAEKRDAWLPSVATLRADLFWCQGNPAAADACLAEACSRNPENLSLVERRIAVLLARRDLPNEAGTEQAEELISDAQSRFGDQPSLRVLRGRIAVRRDSQTAGEVLRELASKTESFTAQQQAVLYRGLAVLAAAKSPAVGLELLRRAVDARPDNVEMLMQLAAAAIQQDARDLFQTTLERLRSIEGTDGPNGDFLEGLNHLRQFDRLAGEAQNNRKPDADGAALRERLKELESARNFLAAVVAVRPSWGVAY
ncbi:MAG: hypothetical protein EHM42_00195, partial [Planctomycetaceae bacterium]